MNIKRAIVQIASIASSVLVGLSLISGMAQAQYSGTNGRIIYSSNNGNITIRSNGNNPFSLSNSVSGSGVENRSVVYSPSGANIAYLGVPASRTDSDLFVQNSTFTATATQLTNDSTSNDIEPYYSPDGTKIAFARQAGSTVEVYVISASGGTATRLTNSINSQPSHAPVWKDNSTIYVINNSDIISIDASTADQATGTTIYDNTAGQNVSAMFDIAPAGNYIIFDTASSGIFRCALSGTCTSPTLIVSPTFTTGITNVAYPAYSPDGTKIIFRNFGSGGTSSLLWIANADGTSPAELQAQIGSNILASNQEQPYWSTNTDTFSDNSSNTPGVPNTSSIIRAQKHSANNLPIVLSVVAILSLMGMVGFWLRLETKKGKK